MKTRYSKITGVFYPLDIQYKELPFDIQEVSLDDYHAALARPSGATFSFDAQGVLTITAAPEPTPEEIAAQKVRAAESAIQSYLDKAAKEKGYESILSATTYAALPSGEPFQDEGVAFATWRARCWAKAYAILADVQAGTRPEPTHDELIAEMPALVLP